MTGSPRLVGLTVSGPATAWRAAGFVVAEGTIIVGEVALRIGAPEPGISAWSLSGLPEGVSVDGLPTHGGQPHQQPTPPHPNGVTTIDHLVVSTGDDASTIAALASLNIDVRRVRTDARPGLRQTFFRIGEPILELISADDDRRRLGRTKFWGVTFGVADLDATAAALGDNIGDIKPAVQPGRRIATLRGNNIGIEVPVAFLSGLDS